MKRQETCATDTEILVSPNNSNSKKTRLPFFLNQKSEADNATSPLNSNLGSVDTAENQIQPIDPIVISSWEKKLIKLGEIATFIGTAAGNIMAQSFNSIHIANIKTTIANTLNSLKYSAAIIALEAFSEPWMFKKWGEIKKWALNKWDKNNIYLGKENIAWSITKLVGFLSLLSYGSVILDKLSNEIFDITNIDNYYSFAILQSWLSEFVLSFSIMTCHEKIIETILELPIVNKFFGLQNEQKVDNNIVEKDNNDSININVDLNSNDDEKLVAPQTELNTKIRWYKVLLPIAICYPVSILASWTNEMLISDNEFTIEKLANDILKTAGFGALSIFSSFLNCGVNNDGLALDFMYSPLIRGWNKVTSWFKKDNNNLIINNPNDNDNIDELETEENFINSFDKLKLVINDKETKHLSASKPLSTLLS